MGRERIVINGKEISSPFLRGLFKVAVAVIGLGTGFVVLLVVLPVVGFSITVSLGLVGLLLLAVLLGIPLLVVGSILFSLLLVPLSWLASLLKGERW